jgi:hypothetical protein
MTTSLHSSPHSPKMDPATIFPKRIRQYSTLLAPQYLREYLSRNPAITIDMVLQDIQLNPSHKEEWRFERLCYSIPLEDLVANQILPTRDTALLGPDVIIMKITIQTILKTHTLFEYHWGYLIQLHTISIEDILAHPELPWNYNYLICNPNFRYQHIHHFRHLIDPAAYRQLFYYLSRSATYEDISNHPEEPWCMRALSSPHIQKEHFLALLPYFQEKHKEIIHTDKRCFQVDVMRNPNLTFEDFIEIFGDDAFDYACSIPRFTVQDFLKYKDKWCHPVDFCSILPMSVIQSYPCQNWNYEIILCSNNTLTYDSLKEIPKKVNERDARQYLFINQHLPSPDKKRLLEELLPKPYTAAYFSYTYKSLIESEMFLEPTFQEIKEYFAKKRIVRIVVEAMSNPAYNQCRKRLFRELTAENSELLLRPTKVSVR